MLKANVLTRKPFSLVAGCLFASAIFSPLAHAEFSIGALGGLANYNTSLKGDAIYAFGGPGAYYQYPQDIYSNDFGGGFTARYLRAFNPRFSLGVEGGYVFLTQNNTVNRANDLLPNPTWVENFTTKSNGVVLANVVANWMVVPAVTFSLFGGPAWLNTNYTANDFHDGTIRTASSNYQTTGDLGVETAWEFKPNWAVGMRFDYIFNTSNRTIATTGLFGDPLLNNDVANSGLSLFSATLKYIIPEQVSGIEK